MILRIMSSLIPHASRASMPSMPIPYDILRYILKWVDAETLYTFQRVFPLIAQDHGLVRMHPHHIIKGRPYLNEEVYSKTRPNKELLQEVAKKGMIDIPWLVARTTKVILESKLTPIGWYILHSRVWHTSAIWPAAPNKSDESWTDARAAVWRGSIEPGSFYTIWHAARDLGWLKKSNAQKHFGNTMELPHQVTACLRLLYIDKNVCDRIQRLVVKHDLEGITFQIPAGILPNNPWIQQFRELFQNLQGEL